MPAQPQSSMSTVRLPQPLACLPQPLYAQPIGEPLYAKPIGVTHCYCFWRSHLLISVNTISINSYSQLFCILALIR